MQERYIVGAATSLFKNSFRFVSSFSHSSTTTKPFAAGIMKNVGIYLTFEGNCEEAFNFYKSVFGGEFGWLGTYGKSPMAKDIPKEQHDKIMHMSLTIGNKFDLMGSDRTQCMGPKPSVVGTNTQISVSPDTKEEADRLFHELFVKDGGKVEVPMEDQFWGSYFGCGTDKYGIRWMVDYPSGSTEKILKSEMKMAAKSLREAIDITTKQAALLEKLSTAEEAEGNNNEEKKDDDENEVSEPQAKKLKA